MRLQAWDKLPPSMQREEIRPYYESLRKKRVGLFFKRVFDVVASFLMLTVLLPFFLILAIAIKIDSPGPVFYRQVRVTQYGKQFRTFKFRSMVQHADKGSKVTVEGDSRVTRVGRVIRKCRLDELCQLIDVLRGTMTFVGTRPEVPKFAECYTPEMMATLLLPAGVTNLTSIYYKDEERLLANAEDPEQIYVREILPQKMYYNLKGLKQFSLLGDFKLMFMTVFAMLGKEYTDEHQTQQSNEPTESNL